MHKEDLALNNLQWLICYKIKPNQTKSNIFNIYVIERIWYEITYNY